MRLRAYFTEIIKRSRGTPVTQVSPERKKKSFRKYHVREETFIYSDGDCVGFRYHNIKYKERLPSGIPKPVNKTKKPRQYGKVFRKKDRKVADTHCGPPMIWQKIEKRPSFPIDEEDQQFHDKIKKELDKLDGLDLRTEDEKREEFLENVARNLRIAPYEPTIAITSPPPGRPGKFDVSIIPIGGGDPDHFQIIEYPWPRYGDPIKRWRLPPFNYRPGNAQYAQQRLDRIKFICDGISRADRIKYDVDCLRKILEGEKGLAFEPFKDPWLMPRSYVQNTVNFYPLQPEE